MSQVGSHLHILVDADDGFVLVVRSKTNVLDWTKILENIIKED